MSDSLGALTIATQVALSGLVELIAPFPPTEPLSDVYIWIYSSTNFSIQAQSVRNTLYQAPTITNVTLGTSTLTKGQTYPIHWMTTGGAFPVSVFLYQGSLVRKTVTGVPCVPWYDPSTSKIIDGCIQSYDLKKEMCATKVDSNGKWVFYPFYPLLSLYPPSDPFLFFSFFTLLPACMHHQVYGLKVESAPSQLSRKS